MCWVDTHRNCSRAVISTCAPDERIPTVGLCLGTPYFWPVNAGCNINHSHAIATVQTLIHSRLLGTACNSSYYRRTWCHTAGHLQKDTIVSTELMVDTRKRNHTNTIDHLRAKQDDAHQHEANGLWDAVDDQHGAELALSHAYSCSSCIAQTSIKTTSTLKHVSAQGSTSGHLDVLNHVMYADEAFPCSQ